MSKFIPSVGVLLLLLGSASWSRAQDDAAEKPERPAARQKAKRESPKKGLTIELGSDWFVTREEHPVKLAATYYYGNANKETVPVLLLHDANGSRKDFAPLIDQLVSRDYAVLAPDLRGHGNSTRRYEITPPKIEMKTTVKHRSGSGSSNRKPKTITEPVVTAPASKKMVDYLVEDFQPLDYMMMLRADLPLLKNTLEKVHAEGMINMNRLVVIGVGRGAALASLLATQDWKDKDSDRFTRTLILIAPTDITPGMDTSRLFVNNRWLKDNLAVLMAVPENDMAGMTWANNIRTILLDKDAEEDKGGMDSKFPIMTYPTTKTVKKDKVDTKVEMSRAEIFSNATTKLTPTILQFLEKRNAGFKEREARWTKLK